MGGDIGRTLGYFIGYNLVPWMLMFVVYLIILIQKHIEKNKFLTDKHLQVLDDKRLQSVAEDALFRRLSVGFLGLLIVYLLWVCLVCGSEESPEHFIIYLFFGCIPVIPIILVLSKKTDYKKLRRQVTVGDLCAAKETIEIEKEKIELERLKREIEKAKLKKELKQLQNELNE